MVVTAVATAAGGGQLAIGEWLINFTPVTSAVSLALDIATPNQLNVGGSLNILGGFLKCNNVALNGAYYYKMTNDFTSPTSAYNTASYNYQPITPNSGY
jgi:hypothetical protein